MAGSLLVCHLKSAQKAQPGFLSIISRYLLMLKILVTSTCHLQKGEQYSNIVVEGTAPLPKPVNISLSAYEL